jgi:hypothetical protein
MKELEHNILELFRSYKIPRDNISFDKLVRENKLEYLSPVQLQKYLKGKYNIKLKYKDAEQLELMILAYSYAGNTGILV